MILRNQIFRILKNHFRAKPYYADLIDLFNEVIVSRYLFNVYKLFILVLNFISLQVEFQTASGQMLDLITTIEGEKDLGKYKLPV